MNARRRRWRRARWSRAWYRTLLLAYPSAFRKEHGPDAIDVFADLAHATACRGNGALLALWLRSIPAVVRGGIEERRGARLSGPAPSGPSWRFETMMNELRQSLRALVRRPGFTATAVLTLALGIGATTAVFSVVDAVLLRPLPYPDADQLVVVSHPVPEISATNWQLSQAGYFYFREHADALEDIGVYRTSTAVISIDGEPERVNTALVTASVMTTLGVAPEIGRPLSPADDTPGAAPVVLLSHGFVARAFGGDAGVVGSSIVLSGESHDVVGVMPEEFGFPDSQTDVWKPYRLDPGAQPVNSHFLSSIARLRTDATPEEARGQLVGLVGRFPEEMPTAYGGGFIESSGFRVELRGLLEETVGDVSTLLWIVLSAATLVLAIACANVANLTMLRAEGRRRELAVRGALGASRGAVLRYSLLESVAVALTGGAIGVVLAWVGVRLLVAASPDGLARVDNIALRPQALLLALAAAVVVSLVLGIVTALQVGADLAEQLKGSGRSVSADRKRLSLRGSFVVAQVAIVVLLMVGSGVLLRTLVNKRAVDPGFEAEGVLTLQLSLSPAKYPDNELAFQAFERILDGIRGLQGVTAVGATTALPLVSSPFQNANGVADLPDGSETTVNIDTRFISPGLIEALGMRLIDGRSFERRDMRTDTPGAVVSRALAQEQWPGESPIGKRVRPLMTSYPWHTVVGVIDDVREEDITSAPEPTVYFPYTDLSWRSFTFAVRTDSEPSTLIPAVRREVWAVDPEVPIASVATMSALVADRLSSTTFTLILVGVATLMALLLCAVGIYGVIAYSVRQRHFEIGVRMALGAQAAQVGRMVVGQTLLLASIGIVIGIGLALASMGMVESLLYEVAPTDPATLVAVVMGLVGVAVLAGALPARRATRVDAVVALQGD